MRITILLIFLASACYAQEFEKVRLGFAVGQPLSWPGSNSSTNTPIILNFEPAVRINDRVMVGFRMEAGFKDKTVVRSNGFFAQYYLSNKQFRPFIGLGAGIYKPSTSYFLNNEQYATGNEQYTFGFYPRIGFDFGHLTVAVDYNIAGTSRNTLTNENTGTSSNGELKSDYASVKIGFFIGGGRKK